MPMIPHDGRTIHYEWAEEGTDVTRPVLVLLNGLVTDSRVFEEYYADLIERGFGLVTIDNTNRGESTHLDAPITLDQMVEEILAVIRHEGIRHPVWIGQSAFAGLALRLAVAVPSAGLVLEAPILTGGNEERIELMKTIMARNFRDESLMEVAQFLGFFCLSSGFLKKNRFFLMGMLMVIRNLYGHRAFEVVWRQIVASLIDGAPYFARLDCPLLVVYGDEECLQPRRLLAEAIGARPHTFEVVPSGHFVISEAPALLFSHIERFMRTQVVARIAC